MPVAGDSTLAEWLSSQHIALAFTTYRANRLMFLGVGERGQLKLHGRLFDRPMGLFFDGRALWMVGRRQIWRLDNLLATSACHQGGDRLYVPAASFLTGDVNAHEVVIDAGGTLLFVNTAFSCIASLTAGYSFAPTWQPPFLSRLAADDRCHLNGLALQDGIATWVTACGATDQSAGWRQDRSTGGVVLHIPSNAIVASGLAMPHSPRWYDGKLWLLNSGTGELGWIEADRFSPLCFLPGFARGLAFAGGCAVVGLSQLRSPQFSGLPLEERLSAAGIAGGCCGLWVIDLTTGSTLHSLQLPEPIAELFDVVVLPGVRQPRALGLQGEEIDCLVRWPGCDQLVTVRPQAPAATPNLGDGLRDFGLPAADSSRNSPVNDHPGVGDAPA
ncbi:MAG: TIGR03032 family protein, partial [Synechococcaceae cyanobacterium]|nr:TIGR03032 family protein [Synechococcaceae cyanobacterium]